MTLLHRGRVPRLAVLALCETLRQKNLKPLLHLAGGFVGESPQGSGRDRHRAHQWVSDAMGEGACLATASARHHQQWPLVMVNRPTLGVVEAGEERHINLSEASP